MKVHRAFKVFRPKLLPCEPPEAKIYIDKVMNRSVIAGIARLKFCNFDSQ